MTSSSSKSSTLDPTIAQGRLLASLTAAFYALFTLLPNSSSLVVAWPFVFIWQVALLTPMLWLLWQIGLGQKFRGLGRVWDEIALVGLLGLCASNLGATFPNQAHWYGWAVLGVISALYALHHWLWSPESLAAIRERRTDLFLKQGYLSLAFILISLFLWLTQTLIPYFSQLQQFQALGVNLSFSFNTLELRNWAPIGHQNYVGGYLVLALPLFMILAWRASGKGRILWLTALVLGLLNLYSTSSRGAWFAFVCFLLWAFIGVILQGKIHRRWLMAIAAGVITFLSLIILTNDRFKSDFSSLLQGQFSGETAYRFLNSFISWQMGSSHPLTGIGLGGVPLLYQKYRPFWAGRESEFIYQLHSTPAQLFAEMGGWGLALLLAGIGGLIYAIWQWFKVNTPQSSNFVEFWSISGALFAYGVMSLTDYQLDNLCISGFLVIYWVSLMSYCQESNESLTAIFTLKKLTLPIAYGGLALIFAVCIWLFPIQRAWQLSNQGFSALSAKKLPIFVEKLTAANQLAPWEAYYPFQLGWNLGDIALTAPDQNQQNQLLQMAIHWFETGIQVSPYQEFAYNNTAWLQIGSNPPQATKNFAQALNLVAAKRGVFYGLGISLLAQQKIELAIQAFSWECLRDPLFITSPFWRGGLLKNIYPQVLATVETQLNQFIKTLQTPANHSSPLLALLHQIRGGLYWWQGNLTQAKDEIQAYGSPVAQGLMVIAEGKTADLKTLSAPARQVIEAWQTPAQRSTLLQQAWISATQMPLTEELEKQLILSMQETQDFKQWLTLFSPALQYRRERLGFGINSRHIDGPNPKDFFLVLENLPMVTWFDQLLPSPVYNPEFDQLLQPGREKFLKQFLEQ